MTRPDRPCDRCGGPMTLDTSMCHEWRCARCEAASRPMSVERLNKLCDEEATKDPDWIQRANAKSWARTQAFIRKALTKEKP